MRRLGRDKTPALLSLSLLVISSLAALPLALPAAASTSISITASNGSAGCAEIGGTWTSATDTCAAPGISIPAGVTLTIGIGVTVTGTGTGRLLSGEGLGNAGTIDNQGTLVGSGGSGTPAGGVGIVNTGTINNQGVVTGNGGTGGAGGVGIANTGTINNQGSLTANGGSGAPVGLSIENDGTVNNEGTVASTGLGNYNPGVVNDYCGGGPGGSFSGTVNTITCYTVTFEQSGIPASGVTWGVTAQWGPFPSTRVTGTGMEVVISAVGSLVYSYDSSVTEPQRTYGCGSGCSGATTVSGALAISASYTLVSNSGPQSIPSSAVPAVLKLITYGGTHITGNRVEIRGSTFVVYNFPTLNQTQLERELSQGNAALLPATMSYCYTTVGGERLIRVSGFSGAWWGSGLLINSTEIIFGDYTSFTTGGTGWPVEPPCSS